MALAYGVTERLPRRGRPVAGGCHDCPTSVDGARRLRGLPGDGAVGRRSGRLAWFGVEGAVLGLVVLAVLGLVLLTVAADHLVVGSGRLADRLHVAPVVVGVVVIGLGTSTPEFLVSGLAAARGDTGLAVGNLVGSNIVNLTVILGIAALIAPVAVRSSVVRREAPLSVAATVLFAVALWLGLGWVAGAILGLVGVAALVLLVRVSRVVADPVLPGETTEFLDQGARRGTMVEVLRTVLGLAGTLAGAQLLVSNAAALAGRLGVPQTVIGFTLVAIGTSLPELVTAVQAQRRRESDLLVGNLLGSNLFNSLFGGAVVGLAGGSGRHVIGLPVLVIMVLVAVLAWALLLRGLRVTRPEGIVLLATYAITLPWLT